MQRGCQTRGVTEADDLAAEVHVVVIRKCKVESWLGMTVSSPG